MDIKVSVLNFRYILTLNILLNCINFMLMQWFSEISNLNWDDALSSDYLCYGCDTFTYNINSVRERFNVSMQIKSQNKNYLPWFNENLQRLMKTRDAALRKAIKTRTTFHPDHKYVCLHIYLI